MSLPLSLMLGIAVESLSLQLSVYRYHKAHRTARLAALVTSSPSCRIMLYTSPQDKTLVVIDQSVQLRARALVGVRVGWCTTASQTANNQDIPG